MQKDFQEEQELFEHHRFEADKGQKLLRVDKFLQNKIEHISRTKIQDATDAGCIKVNDTPVKSNYKVKPGDTVIVVMPRPKFELELIPEDIPLKVVHEEDEFIVIDKDPGMVVHPGHGNYTGTLVNALMFHMKDSPLFRKGEERPGLVHRIDKNTSGLLVVAKTEYALSHLARQFFERTTNRKYTAIVWGSMKEDSGTITGHIGRHQKDRMRFAVYPGGEEGKHAVTHYKVLEHLGYVDLVECKLETGRTHQIRVHMEYTGHPLFNDERYGGDKILKGTTFTKYKQFVENCFKILPRHALHARTLEFEHPRTGKRINFDSPLPEDMRTVIEKWKRYISSR